MTAQGAARPPLVVQQQGPNLLIRALWFVFIGWWLGGLVSTLARLLVLTIIGLPLGLWLINRLPRVITLRPQEATWHLENGMLVQGQPQRPFWLRAAYFLLVGWWLSGAWMLVAYLALASIVLLPLAFWMYGRIGAVTTLYRS
jgi:uncharacterized membrane protein YccF (DUF307 family)